MRTILKYKDEIEDIKLVTTKNEQRYLHIKSIENFIFHFDKVKSPNAKNEILNLLSNYLVEIREYNCRLTKDQSTELGKRFIWEIGYYYRDSYNFKIRMSLSFVFFVGFHLDLVLFITGALKKVHYIPIVTISFLLYWAYSKIFFENKRRVYGIRY